MNNIDEKKTPESEVEDKPQIRQIIIETDGNIVNLIKADVSGRIELVGILQTLLSYLNNQK